MDASADIISVVSEALYKHIFQYVTNRFNADYDSAVLPGGRKGGGGVQVPSVLPRIVALFEGFEASPAIPYDDKC
jgi:hypothetical protein